MDKTKIPTMTDFLSDTFAKSQFLAPLSFLQSMGVPSLAPYIDGWLPQELTDRTTEVLGRLEAGESVTPQLLEAVNTVLEIINPLLLTSIGVRAQEK